jgi:hypothetical protein
LAAAGAAVVLVSGAAVTGADTSGTVAFVAFRLLLALFGFEQAAATIPRMAMTASVLTNLDRDMNSPNAKRTLVSFDTYPLLPALMAKNLTPVSGAGTGRSGVETRLLSGIRRPLSTD